MSTLYATIEFQLTVKPCIVTDFAVISTPDAQISYTLGEETFTFGSYQFAMTPECGYSTDLNFIEMPSDLYIAHNESDRTFTVL